MPIFHGSKRDGPPKKGTAHQGEQGNERLLDFSNCRGLTQIIQRLIALRNCNMMVQTSIGPMSPQDVAQRLEKSIEAIWDLQRTKYKTKKGQNMFYHSDELPLLSSEEIDGILASKGITDRGSLRTMITNRLVRSTKVHHEYMQAIDAILQRGEFNSVWQLNEEEFMEQYPQELYERIKGDKRPHSDLTDTETQVHKRWQEILETRSRAKAEAKTTVRRQWEQQWKDRVWDEKQVTKLTFAQPDGERTYQAAVAKAKAKEAEILNRISTARRFGRTIVEYIASAHTIAGQVEQAFQEVFCKKVEGRRVVVYNTVQVKGRNLPAIARTLELPIAHKADTTVRITILSGLEKEHASPEEYYSREKVDGLGGIVLESASSLSLLYGQYPNTDEEFQSLQAMQAQLQQVEQLVKQRLGLELNLVKIIDALTVES